MQLFEVYKLFDIEPVRGKGCYVYDQNGTAYLDCYGGHGVMSVGHSHPHYIQRINEQLQQLAFYSNYVKNSLRDELAQLLGTLSGCEAYQLFLINSGAEANENALKMASFYNGKSEVIAFRNGYHGRTSGAINVTDMVKYKASINQRFPVTFLDFNDLEAVERSMASGRISAIILECIQGIGGIQLPTPEFLREVARLCKKYEVLLIADEVQSGYGRSGKFFAFQHAGIEPDLITIAKGMGNGFPIGGLLLHPRFKARIGLLGTTFGGTPLACAAALAVLEIIRDENLIENAALMGSYFHKQLASLSAFKAVRGKGLMIGVETEQPITPLRETLAYQEKVFTGTSANPKVIRILPPLSIQKSEIDSCLRKIQAALANPDSQQKVLQPSVAR